MSPEPADTLSPRADSLVEHWEERGRAAASSETDAVCYPGAPTSLNHYADWSQRRAVRALLDTVGPLGGKRALDVGCGTGRWSRLLAARGAIVLGTDRSESMLAEARRRGAGEYRAMDVTRLELADDAFDLATAVTVIQHLAPARQEAAVSELVRVVRPGGFVLTIDRVGRASSWSEGHGTFPRPRSEWHTLWSNAGADLVVSRGQEFSYPLALTRLGRVGKPAGAVELTMRRGGRGWRRVVLDGLVAASYATEVVGERIPRAPAEHVAALYAVR